MQELLAQIFTYVWGVWRYRWLALAIAWVVAICGWLWVWQLPESYVASARIYVDTNSLLRPLLRGLAVEPNIDQRINMMSRTLLSRPNLEKLMRMTDLDLEINGEVEKNAMLADLGQAVRLSGSRENASLYSISVSDPERDTAKRIAQSLITVFIESSLSGKREDSSDAENFLEAQISEYEARLVAAENRLALFKQENVDVLPGSGGDYYSRLQGARQDLELARLQLSELENRRDALERQIVGEEPVIITNKVAVPTAGIMSPVDSRIQSMRVRLDELLAFYTEKHPQVRQLQSLIEELESEKVVAYQRVRQDASAGTTGLSNSPVYQGMRTMLAQTEASVAELQVRVAEYERRVTDLEKKVDNIPEIEAELKQLDRDYAVISGQHQQLLGRREAARLSQDIEQNASDVTFRVIDPPFVPLEPSEPNKLMLNGVVLLVALAAGVGASFLLSMIFPVVTDARTLVDITGLPILGSVTLRLLPEQKRKEVFGVLTFASLSCGLLIVCIVMSLEQSSALSI